MIELLENPLIQLFLIAVAGMGASWLSERNEQQRVAAGLQYRPLKERVLEGIGFTVPVERVLTQSRPTEDIWVAAAKELDLPIDKVLLLKQRVLDQKPEPTTKPAKKKTA